MPSNRRTSSSRGRKPALPNRSSEPHELPLPRTFPIAGTEIVPQQVWRIPDRHPRLPGPWKGEPDRLAWIDAATGYSCLILRQRSGALSGYVSVPVGHPLWGYEHDAVPPSLGISAHRGLNYSQYCDDSLAGTPGAALRICHTQHEAAAVDLMRERDPLDKFTDWVAHAGRDPLAEPELEPAKMAWWFGFSTDFPGDLEPLEQQVNHMGAEAPVYRDLSYVFTEVVGLAGQLHALTKANEPLAVAPPPPESLASPQARKRQKRDTAPGVDAGAPVRAGRGQNRQPPGNIFSAAPPRQNPLLPGKGGADEQA